MPLNYYPYLHWVPQGFNVANGLAAMYPLYVNPENEDGPFGERIFPRWIGRERYPIHSACYVIHRITNPRSSSS